MVPESLTARPVDHLVRCCTGHTSDKLCSHLPRVATEQGLSILMLAPWEDKAWVFKQNRPPSKQPKPAAIEVMQAERLWTHTGHLDADPQWACFWRCTAGLSSPHPLTQSHRLGPLLISVLQYSHVLSILNQLWTDSIHPLSPSGMACNVTPSQSSVTIWNGMQCYSIPSLDVHQDN